MTDKDIFRIMDRIADLFDDNGYDLDATQELIIETVIREEGPGTCRYAGECVYSHG